MLYWHEGWGALWMLVMMAVVWVPLLLLTIWLVRLLAAPSAGRAEAMPPRGDDGVAIARRAYAAGEIDRDEFLQRVADLEAPRHFAAGAPGGGTSAVQ